MENKKIKNENRNCFRFGDYYSIFRNDIDKKHNRKHLTDLLRQSIRIYFKRIYNVEIPNENKWDKVDNRINKDRDKNMFYDLVWSNDDIRMLIDYISYIDSSIDEIEDTLFNDDEEISFQFLQSKLSSEDFKYFTNCESVMLKFMNMYFPNDDEIYWFKFLNRNYKTTFSNDIKTLNEQLKLNGFKKGVGRIKNELKEIKNSYNKITNKTFSYEKFTFIITLYENGIFDIDVISKDFIKDEYKIYCDRQLSDNSYWFIVDNLFKYNDEEKEIDDESIMYLERFNSLTDVFHSKYGKVFTDDEIEFETKIISFGKDYRYSICKKHNLTINKSDNHNLDKLNKIGKIVLNR